MDNSTICCAGSTAAAQYAARILGDQGFRITYEPSADAEYILLDIPSLGSDGNLRGGESLQALLGRIPDNRVLFGGNLDHPALAGRPTVDLLREERYLRENARITAYCALQIIAEALPVTLEEAKVLIIGWGRIGKVLTSVLLRLGTDVTVAARNPAHIAALHELGIKAAKINEIDLSPIRLIVNTVPAPVLSEDVSEGLPGVIMIDLASVKGLPGKDVIWARGLPGIHAPESSGRLIARTVLAHIKEEGK